MAYDAKIKMSIQDAAGNYLSAKKNTNGSWNITTSPTLTYLQTLPKGWEETSITWEREHHYLAVYRSTSTGGPSQFSDDGRAIIQYLRRNGGVQALGTLNSYVHNPGATAWAYDLFYSSQFDFKTYKDNWQEQLLTIDTLDCGLYRDLWAWGDTKFNVPIWKNIGTPTAPVWAMNDSEWIWHDGIKLLFNATFASSATPSNPMLFTPANPTTSECMAIVGYCNGQFGSGGHQGFHTLPNLQQFTITQNNGTTTYIGNDILNPYIIIGNQRPDISANGGVIGHSTVTIGEETFWGTNESRPYTQNNACIKNLLPTASGSFDTYVSVTFNIPGNIDEFATADGMSRVNPFLGFVMWEIGTDPVTGAQDRPPIVTGGGHAYMQYIPIFKYPLNGNGTWLAASTPGTGGNDVTQIAHVTLKYDKAYVFGLIYDDASTNGLPAFDALSNLVLNKLEFAFLSRYDSGASGIPVPAPMFPASAAAAFRLHTVLEKLAPYLATTETDNYGFPIPVSTPYTGKSDFLSNPSLAPIGDVIPYQIMLTSAYCLHDLAGQSYVSISLNQLFDFCKKQLGCGMAIELDPVTKQPTVLRIEPLSYFFDASTVILDLGADIFDFEDSNLTLGLGANLKLGYAKADTNSDFGVDPFCTELYFNTPLSNYPEVMDFEETDILTEMYAISKIIAQKVSQPIGSSIDPANPSGDNVIAAIYCNSSSITLTNTVVDPSNNIIASAPAFTPVKFSNAQNFDPSAATAPYIRGLYYPDTAINVPLSPCRALKRDTGAYLHSILDQQDTKRLIFRNTEIMQYNNTTLALSSIESNLNVGSGVAGVVAEFADKVIGDLPPQLFKPIVYKFKTRYPVNMYQILNSNPNGCIKFQVNNPSGFGTIEKKMFISKVKQYPGTAEATEFIGWATPDMMP